MAAELPEIHLRRDVGRQMADELVRTGEWTRVRRGAFTETPTGEQWERDRHVATATAIATQQLLTNATLAEDSAALVLVLEVWQVPTQSTVIQEYTARSRMPTAVRRRLCTLDDGDIVEIDGVQVTSIERTVLDCARSKHPRDALVIVDSGLRALVQPERDEPRADVEARCEPLRSQLLARIAPGTRGAVQARAILAAADPLAENGAESVVRWIAISRGMPRPRLQQRVDTSRGVAYTDMAWRFQIDGRPMWLHVEFDGSGKYLKDRRRSTAQLLIAERKRESAIRDNGDVVVRVYWDELGNEGWVFTKITQGIARDVVNRYQRVPALYRPPGR